MQCEELLSRLLSLLFILALAGSARAGEVAVLPLDAPGLLPGVRENLEAELGSALSDVGFAVQGREKTDRAIKDAVESGLLCSLAEDDCVRKAAVAASVDSVIVGRALTTDGQLVVELRLIHVESITAVGAAGLVGNQNTRPALVRLARRLLNPAAAVDPGDVSTLPLAIVLVPADASLLQDGQPASDVIGITRRFVWVTPGPHVFVVAKDGYDTRTVPVDIAGDRVPPPVEIGLEKSFPALAAAVGVAGAALAVAGGIGLGVAEARLAGFATPEERATLKVVGLASVATIAVGIATAAAGTAVALAGASE